LKKSGQKVAVIGPLATDKTSPLGNWRMGADVETAVSVMEGLEKYEDNDFTHHRGVPLIKGEAFFHQELEILEGSDSEIKRAKKVAKKADVVIMVLGEHGMDSGEGRSRANIDLPGDQQKLLEAVYEVNKNIVLVLQNGRPLAIPWAAENIPAIVEAWHLGIRSGDAIAQVLHGDYIGFGLSYTKFNYEALSVSPSAGGAKVSVTVRNTGDVDGEEVVQLYIQDKVASVTRPKSELKGFEKVMIPAGTSKTIEFELSDSELGFYDNEGKFIVEEGEFDIMVGTSSAEYLLRIF